MIRNPLAEVFGFPICNCTKKATHYREAQLCPFSNKVPNCTKDKAESPLGVCSVFHNGSAVITCPTRFREDWLIIENAARFAFPQGSRWTSLSEIRLADNEGQSAGNIDYVVVRCNEKGEIVDFASIEVQGVYISGNLRHSFESYMASPSPDFCWDGKYFPRPDYLSSSRKRLIPQMLYKGGIFKAWKKKQCVVLQKSFYDTLPPLERVPMEQADIAWFLYDLVYSEEDSQMHLELVDTIYTEFQQALHTIITPIPGSMEQFMGTLQEKLDEKIQQSPDTHTLLDLCSI